MECRLMWDSEYFHKVLYIYICIYIYILFFTSGSFSDSCIPLPVKTTDLKCVLYCSVSLQHLPQSYTPVNGLRELPMGAQEETVDPPFPPVWDWVLQYSGQRRARFTQPVSQPTCPPPVLNGNLNTNLDRSWVRCAVRTTLTVPFQQAYIHPV